MECLRTRVSGRSGGHNGPFGPSSGPLRELAEARVRAPWRGPAGGPGAARPRPFRARAGGPARAAAGGAARPSPRRSPRRRARVELGEQRRRARRRPRRGSSRCARTRRWSSDVEVLRAELREHPQQLAGARPACEGVALEPVAGLEHRARSLPPARRASPRRQAGLRSRGHVEPVVERAATRRAARASPGSASSTSRARTNASCAVGRPLDLEPDAIDEDTLSRLPEPLLEAVRRRPPGRGPAAASRRGRRNPAPPRAPSRGASPPRRRHPRRSTGRGAGQAAELPQLPLRERGAHRRDDRLEPRLAKGDHVGVSLDDDRAVLASRSPRARGGARRGGRPCGRARPRAS